MSYIDTFDHQYVGEFAALPIYYPRTQVESGGGEDFGCGPNNLVLGGGSGEHPALVLHRLDCLAMHFLFHAVDEHDKEERDWNDQFGDFPIWDYLNVPFTDLFEYADWSVKDYHYFYERCSSPAMNFPYFTDNYFSFSFEQWLAVSFGELVWFSFPSHLTNFIPIRKVYPNLLSITDNITIPPPGYPERFGRKLVRDQVIKGDHYFKQAFAQPE